MRFNFDMELCVKKHSKKRYIGIYTILFLIVRILHLKIGILFLTDTWT